MRFKDLRDANDTRRKEWPGDAQADLSFRALEVAGEAGELCEAMKKYLRGQKGIAGSTATLEQVAEEMADCLIAVDLLAGQLGIDLGQAVQRKFNKTSEKYGLNTRIPETSE